MTNPLRNLPSVNEVLDSAPIQELAREIPRSILVKSARQAIDETRQAVRAGAEPPAVVESVVGRAQVLARAANRPNLRTVLNATGILLHTGLGRAPLAAEAAAALHQVASGYSPVELELETGSRGKRTQLVRGLLSDVTGAESATVVNNNAAATLIVLSTLARGKDVVVSRGELVEIGGSFRLPDIMATSGARLREVGTTNKTRLSDYESALDEHVAALMKVHTSNYKITGFTESVTTEQLVALGRKSGVPVIDDIGSGALIDFTRFGFQDEPLARDSIVAGADVILFSGDKLLGGPQSGIIVGKAEWIDRIEKNPLMRAFRVGKLTLAALEATLRLYLSEQSALEGIPLLRMLSESNVDLEQRTREFAAELAGLQGIRGLRVERDEAFLGGGSIPGQAIPSWALKIEFALSEAEVARRLRIGEPSVVARSQDGFVVFNLTTIFPPQQQQLLEAIRTVCNSDSGKPRID